MTVSQGVLVTAAGQSVGRAMAEKFLARGDRVHICDIKETLKVGRRSQPRLEWHRL